MCAETRHRPLAWLALASYVVVMLGAVGLEVRPPHNAPPVETTLSRIVSLLWIAGAIIAIPTAWRDHWIERVGVASILGGTLIALIEAVLLDMLPSWPPLARPVLTITALCIGVMFFFGRLIDLRHERPHLPAEDEIQRADKLRGMSA